MVPEDTPTICYLCNKHSKTCRETCEEFKRYKRVIKERYEKDKEK